jgi:hypothetical protein
VNGIQSSGLLRKVASGLANCRLALMAAQDEGYDKESPEQTKNYKRVCLMERGNEIYRLDVGFFMHKIIISLVLEFVINTNLCT